jgi:membrane dipeptidase
LIDGHNDLPWGLRSRYDSDLDKFDLHGDMGLSSGSPDQPALTTDLPRMRAGMQGGQFWSVWVPASLQGAEAAETVRQQIDLVRRIVAAYPRDFAFARNADDVLRIHRSGRIASMIGMEGGEPIHDYLAILRAFRAEGVAYMTLCHSQTTSWVDSATDAPKHGGLSPFGENVVREMNRIGMLVDLSHVSADAMRDALRVAAAPVIFSHSSAFTLTRSPRNVPDDVLEHMEVNGGVVMVNFYPGYVSEPYRLWLADKKGEEARQKALFPGDPAAAKAGLDAWKAKHPAPVVTIKEVADHIDYIAGTAGFDHVGIGSDFDGVEALPEGLNGPVGYPALFIELVRRGWSDENLAKLAGGNILRVMREAERVAAGEAIAPMRVARAPGTPTLSPTDRRRLSGFKPVRQLPGFLPERALAQFGDEGFVGVQVFREGADRQRRGARGAADDGQRRSAAGVFLLVLGEHQLPLATAFELQIDLGQHPGVQERAVAARSFALA